LRRGQVEQEGQDRQRQYAEQHLPGDEIERVETVVALEILGRDRARRPAQPGGNRPQLRPEIAVPLPRLDHEHHAGQRAGERKPLVALDPLVQHRPREQQRPEWQRVTPALTCPAAPALIVVELKLSSSGKYR
jgi:hypothetical protein